MSESSIAERVFSIKEAAEHLRISRSKLYLLAEDNKLRIAKIGGRSVVTGKEMLRFIGTL